MSSSRIGILDRRTGRTQMHSSYGTTVIGSLDDHVIWVMTTGSVMAAPLDKNGELGAPKLVLEDVLGAAGRCGESDAVRGGFLIYQRGVSLSQLMVVDEHGAAAPFGVEPRAFGHPRWSPDGARIAIAIGRTGGSDIWLIDAKTKTTSSSRRMGASTISRPGRRMASISSTDRSNRAAQRSSH